MCVCCKCMYMSLCSCLHLSVCVCGGQARIGVPAGTTLVNNGSFILPEHLTGLCVATATHTHTEPERKHTYRRLHTFIRKILGVFTGGQFSLTLDTCVYVCLRFSFFVFWCVCVVSKVIWPTASDSVECDCGGWLHFWFEGAGQRKQNLRKPL